MERVCKTRPPFVCGGVHSGSHRPIALLPPLASSSCPWLKWNSFNSAPSTHYNAQRHPAFSSTLLRAGMRWLRNSLQQRDFPVDPQNLQPGRPGQNRGRHETFPSERAGLAVRGATSPPRPQPGLRQNPPANAPLWNAHSWHIMNMRQSKLEYKCFSKPSLSEAYCSSLHTFASAPAPLPSVFLDTLLLAGPRTLDFWGAKAKGVLTRGGGGGHILRKPSADRRPRCT